MSKQALSTPETAPDAAMKTAPGVTRRYWHMKCSVNGKLTRTASVAPENSLKIPPQLYATDSSVSSSGVSAPKQSEMAEMSSGEIEDAVESSQDTKPPPNSFGDVMSEEALLAVEGSPMGLSDEQKAVLHMVLNSRMNIFFTGAAGTGKSVLLRCIIRQLRKKYGASRVAVTALTGIAACNIGGQTLHRFAGVGLARDPVDELLRRMSWNQATYERWRETQVLLIDEVSMLDIELLEKLEEIGRRLRKNSLPFGGIQIICTGDLFQLPPVEKAPALEKRFCFETPLWDRIIDRTVNLTRVFRQQDPRFANTLNELRLGHVSTASERLFAALSRPPKLPKGIVPTQLFSTRREVNNANASALQRLVGTEYVYDCADWKDVTRSDTKYLDIGRDVLAEDRLKLKVGAQVMLIKNIDNTLVNGSVGRVVAFMSPSASYTDYGGMEGRESHFRSRSLASKTDSNGDPEDNAERIGKIMGAYGDSPAASRKRKLAEEMSTVDAQKTAVLPVVKFVTAQNTARFMMVHPETWAIEDADGNQMVSRTQLPLILAWALSIHKSQGQTLPYVSVDLKNIFERGQAYVAISRATCVEGLQVMNFTSNRVIASPKVVQYYEKLETISPKEIADANAYFAEVAAREEQQRIVQEAARAAQIVKEEQEAELEASAAGAQLPDSSVDGTDPEYMPKSESEASSELGNALHDPEVVNLISDYDDFDADHAMRITDQVKRRRVVVESSSPIV